MCNLFGLESAFWYQQSSENQVPFCTCEPREGAWTAVHVQHLWDISEIWLELPCQGCHCSITGRCCFPNTLWWTLFASPNSEWQFSAFAPCSLVSRIFHVKLRDIGLQQVMQSPPRAAKAMEKTSTMVLNRIESFDDPDRAILSKNFLAHCWLGFHTRRTTN